MSPLRSQMIRLAHANPELRPHLLPMLAVGQQKTAYVVPIPSSARTFQYEGVDAEAVAAKIGKRLEAHARAIRQQSYEAWKDIAYFLIKHSDLEMDSETARIAAWQTFHFLYMDLQFKSKPYFMRIPSLK